MQYCADQLNLSPNYLSDMMKRTTGASASEHIRRFVIEQAKNRLMAGERVSQVAYSLGFEYPQHLTRLFKKIVGVTPGEYVSKK